jgi:hypothetical protein
MLRVLLKGLVAYAALPSLYYICLGALCDLIQGLC